MGNKYALGKFLDAIEKYRNVLKDADRNLPDRVQAAAQVRDAGYDIRQETLRLQQLYTGLIAERGAAHA